MPTHYIAYCSQVNEKSAQTLLNHCAGLVAQGVTDVCLLLSSPGGSVMHGLTLYNVLRGLPFNLTTHNVGSVDSIGNVIFMAGRQRYACSNSTFLFHGVSFAPPAGMVFDEMLAKERLDSIRADHVRIAQVISQNCNLTVQEIERYFLDAKTKNPQEALADGIVHDIRDVAVPQGAPITQIIA